MPKRKNDPGYLLPEVINPEENCCICIPIPNDFNHKMAFLGQLDELGYWWNWERDTDKKGREAAQVWRKIVECIREEMNMSGCGCSDDGEYNVLERFNSDGQLEASTDGGVTWHLAPERDARNAVILFPPRQTGSADDKCLSAENAAGFFKATMDTIFAQLAAGGGAAGAAPAVIALLITIGFPTGLGAALALVYGLISAVIGLVSAGLDGTFDTAFYDALKCSFYCVIDEDGTLTKSDLDQVFTDMSAYVGGNVIPIAAIGDILNTVGEKGFTNAARGDSIPTSDCSDCNCIPGCANNYEILDGVYLGNFAGYDRFQTTINSGKQWLFLRAVDVDNCCQMLDWRVVGTNPGIINNRVPCGNSNNPPVGAIANWNLGNCSNYLSSESVNPLGTPYTIEILFGDCP